MPIYSTNTPNQSHLAAQDSFMAKIRSQRETIIKSTLGLSFSLMSLNCWLSPSYAQETSVQKAQASTQIQAQPKGPPQDINEIPLPKARGFWGTFFFWSGGVLSMYLVGRHLFKEQVHERETLKRFRDELGHFFPEFDPMNISKWVSIAAPHLYHGWREGDFSSMEGFCSTRFIQQQISSVESLAELKQKRVCYLDKIIAVHTLGAEWSPSVSNSEAEKQAKPSQHPPLGVELTLRVEAKAIDFNENEQGERLSGQAKPNQFQQIWRLIHNGKTWTLDEVYTTDQDITHLAERPPLPPIAEWRRPEEQKQDSPSHQEQNLSQRQAISES